MIDDLSELNRTGHDQCPPELLARVQAFALSDEVTTIGSVAGNTIVLNDPAVSRKHVGIRQSGQGYEFADLGSTNGVYCNGHRMPRKQLAPGDIIRVGNTEIMFRTD